MKRVFYLALLAIALGAFVSCEKSEIPEDILVEDTDSLKTYYGASIRPLAQCFVNEFDSDTLSVTMVHPSDLKVGSSFKMLHRFHRPNSNVEGGWESMEMQIDAVVDFMWDTSQGHFKFVLVGEILTNGYATQSTQGISLNIGLNNDALVLANSLDVCASGQYAKQHNLRPIQ